MSEPPVVSVILPAFNESQSLSGTVRAVAAALAAEPHEIILVDDGSTDGSWAVIGELSGSVPGARGVRLSRNFGHQAALLAGLSTARGAAMITMDADGQHPPGLLPEMVAKWRRGAVVVQGLRAEAADGGWLKRQASRGFYLVFSWLAGTAVRPGSADFRLLDRRAVDIVLAHPRAAFFQRGFLAWSGLRTDYLPFPCRRRAAGASKYSLRRMCRLARDGIMRFSVAPLRLATLLGLFTSALALCYLLYVLYIRIFSDRALVGWASLAGLLALLGGVQLLVVGILGEYMGMVFHAQLDRPPFIVSEQTAEPQPLRASQEPRGAGRP